MSQIQNQAPPDVKVILVGNKKDLEQNERKVTEEEGKVLAKKYGIKFFEASAKTGHNIHKVFEQIASDVLNVIKENPPKILDDDRPSINKGILIAEEKKKCCLK